jgi:hypothetical protein
MDDQSKLECIHDKTVEIGGDTERKRKKKKKFCSDNQQKDGEGTLRCSGFGSKKAPLQRSNAFLSLVFQLFSIVAPPLLSTKHITNIRKILSTKNVFGQTFSTNVFSDNRRRSFSPFRLARLRLRCR